MVRQDQTQKERTKHAGPLRATNEGFCVVRVYVCRSKDSVTEGWTFFRRTSRDQKSHEGPPNSPLPFPACDIHPRMAPPASHRAPSFAHRLADLLRLRPDIARIVRGNVHDVELLDSTEDRVQTVLLRVFLNLSTWDPDLGAFKPWVSTIAGHTLNESRRSRRRYEARFRADDGDVDRALASDPSPERLAQLKQALEKLNEVLCEMPDEQFTVMSLVCFFGETHGEVSELLGISVDASKMKLWRARDFIRERWDPETLFSAAPPLLVEEERRTRWRKLFDLTHRGAHVLAAAMAGSMLWPAPPLPLARSGITYEPPRIESAEALAKPQHASSPLVVAPSKPTTSPPSNTHPAQPRAQQKPFPRKPTREFRRRNP